MSTVTRSFVLGVLFVTVPGCIQSPFELAAQWDGQGPYPGTLVRFSASNGDPRWDFGDGKGAAGAEVTHAYERAGSYVVRASLGPLEQSFQLGVHDRHAIDVAMPDGREPVEVLAFDVAPSAMVLVLDLVYRGPPLTRIVAELLHDGQPFGRYGDGVGVNEEIPAPPEGRYELRLSAEPVGAGASAEGEVQVLYRTSR